MSNIDTKWRTNQLNTPNLPNTADEKSKMDFEYIDIPYPESNFKDIFKSLYSPDKPDIQEGFDIFGNFDMHRKPKTKLDMSWAKDAMDVIKEIRDYILCPIYKSDQIIENGLQTVLSVFLAVQCNDSSLNYFNKKTQVLDMGDLIDPNLLYSDKNNDGKDDITEGFKNKRCSEQRTDAKKEIKQYSKTIKEQIYRLFFLPIVIHIFYNMFYMFCFRDILGNRVPFINVEKEYYEPYLKDYLDYFLGIAVKPLTVLYLIFEYISAFKPLRNFTDKYPYVMYIIVFFIVFTTISAGGKNVFALIGDMITSNSAFFNLFAGIVMAFAFCAQFVKRLPDWAGELSRPISGSIKFIIYWIIKIVINIMIFPMSGYLCVLYFVGYLFFGIFISQNKDVFDVYGDIMDMVFDKIYKLYDPRCSDPNRFQWFIQLVCKYSVVYLFEFAVYLTLISSMIVYSSDKNIKNINVKSFLYIMNFSVMFIFGIWMFMKYFNTIVPLDAKYDILNINDKIKLDTRKKERVQGERPNVMKESLEKEKAEEEQYNKENPAAFSKEAQEKAEIEREAAAYKEESRKAGVDEFLEKQKGEIEEVEQK